MGAEVAFSTGDLLEYTRPMKGRADLPDTMTVRAVVMGVEVVDRAGDPSRERDYSVTVQLYEGAVQFGEPREVGGATVTEGRQDREPELIGYSLDDLMDLDPELVRRGNCPRELTCFEVGK